MAKNKNDKGNQQPDSKSNQSSTVVGNKKEINPNNPTAKQGASTLGKTNTDVKNTKELEKSETTQSKKQVIMALNKTKVK